MGGGGGGGGVEGRGMVLNNFRKLGRSYILLGIWGAQSK